MTTHPHLTPRLKNEKSYISTPTMGLPGLLLGALYLCFNTIEIVCSWNGCGAPSKTAGNSGVSSININYVKKERKKNSRLLCDNISQKDTRITTQCKIPQKDKCCYSGLKTRYSPTGR